jgi:hypothetical protein
MEADMPDTTVAAEYLGRCLDFLQLDPTKYGEPKNWKNIKLIEWDGTESRGGVAVPKGAAYVPGDYAQQDTEGMVINDANTFQDTMTTKFGVNAGAEGVFTASRTESATSEITNMLKSDQVLTMTRAMGQGARVSMPDSFPPTWTLAPQFKSLVSNLPQANDLSNPRSLYQKLIEVAGTHFVSSITLGGFAFQFTSVNKIDKTNKQTSESTVKYAATLKFKEASAGMDSEEAKKQLAELQSKVEINSSTIRWNGGAKQSNLISWVDSLREKPSVAECKLTALTKVLTREYFPADPDIDIKRRNLGKRIAQYVETRGRDTGALLENQPVSIQFENRGDKWALAAVDGSLRWLAVDDSDKRQQWLFDNLRDEYIMAVGAPLPRGSVDIPAGYRIKNVVSGQYLDAGKEVGGGLKYLGLTATRNAVATWRALPATASSVAMESPVREGVALRLLTYDGRGFGEYEIALWKNQEGAAVAIGGGPPRVKVVRRYDALAEFRE